MASAKYLFDEPEETTHAGDGRDERILDSPRSETVFRHLDDDVSRCFLNLMSRDWRTAQELADICETPLSTTYRKLNALDDAGFLDERIRINQSGKHPEEYRSRPMVLTFRIAEPQGLEVSVHTVSETAD